MDGTGGLAALTDGLLVKRYLFGLTGAPLVSNALGVGCTRCAPMDIETYLDSLDVP